MAASLSVRLPVLQLVVYRITMNVTIQGRKKYRNEGRDRMRRAGKIQEELWITGRWRTNDNQEKLKDKWVRKKMKGGKNKRMYEEEGRRGQNEDGHKKAPPLRISLLSRSAQRLWLSSKRLFIFCEQHYCVWAQFIFYSVKKFTHRPFLTKSSFTNDKIWLHWRHTMEKCCHNGAIISKFCKKKKEKNT